METINAYGFSFVKVREVFIVFLFVFLFSANSFSEEMPTCSEQELQKYKTLFLCQLCKRKPSASICQINVSASGTQNSIDMQTFFTSVKVKNPQTIYYLRKKVGGVCTCFAVLENVEGATDYYRDIDSCINSLSTCP